LTIARAAARARAAAAVTVAGLVAAGCTIANAAGGAPEKPVPSVSTTTAGRPAVRARRARVAPQWLGPPQGPSGLAPGSDPAALPGPILVADKANNRLLIIDQYGRVRWMFPRPGDLAAGQTFRIPDDAFFSRDGRSIIATQEDEDVISVIDIATHHIRYRYGVPGTPGSGRNLVSHPDDALLTSAGIVVADIKNCRLLRIAPGSHTPAEQLGRPGGCLHAPPQVWGSPNGAFPLRDGHWLVTEINGDWVDELGPGSVVQWSTHPPGVAYPSDTNQVGPDRYLTVDYSTPGQVVIFNRAGTALWRYRPTGAQQLSHPSLAEPLPNGDVLLNDDFNDRVIVLDPRTNRVVWQYGHTGVAGSAPGYLNTPDGLDLAPPHNLLTRFPDMRSGL
jgi:DNA-binding beta-propeller fold protein YncE